MARRVSAWTTNGLLSVLVVVAGLGFGRQVVRWWVGDAAEPVAAVEPLALLDALNDPGRTVHLEFGDSTWQISRQSIRASREEATRALRAECRRSIPDVTPEDPSGPAETKLLDTLRQRPPVEAEPGKWRLYALDDRLPLVVATRGHVAPESDRVVTWGLAIPSGEASWTLYTFCPPASPKNPPADRPAISLPSASKKVLSLSTDRGGEMLTFEGHGEMAVWQQFFDAQLPTQGWTAECSWQPTASARHRRYTNAAGGSLDLHLRPTGDGRLAGLLLVNPIRAEACRPTPIRAGACRPDPGPTRPGSECRNPYPSSFLLRPSL